ncbi:MAG: GNAT family N-acetyltransferase [bacterium]
MAGGQPTLETARLILRPFQASDAPAVQRLAGAREIADTTLAIPHPYPDGAAAEWIATHAARFAAGTLAPFAVVTRADGLLVGATGLALVMAHAQGELGYWIGHADWGRGYATEAARALLDFGFRGLGLHRIQARHLTRNPASGRVMEKLGMRFEGIHRGAVLKWGTFEDLAQHAILVHEWLASLAAPAPAAPGAADAVRGRDPR